MGAGDGAAGDWHHAAADATALAQVDDGIHHDVERKEGKKFRHQLLIGRNRAGSYPLSGGVAVRKRLDSM